MKTLESKEKFIAELSKKFNIYVFDIVHVYLLILNNIRFETRENCDITHGNDEGNLKIIIKYIFQKFRYLM